jgi:hypothetical protein
VAFGVPVVLFCGLVSTARRTAVAAIAVAMFLAAAPARAANELCGQTITQSLTLGADQTCTGQGLIVGADGVTIDLAGFTLSGDGGTDEFGIDVNGHTNVTITNGTVRGFFDGVVSPPQSVPPVIKLSRIVARENVRRGAELYGQVVVDKSSFISNGSAASGSAGLELGGERAKATSSAFVGNVGAGLRLVAATDATIAKVVAAGNAGHGIEVSNGIGVVVQGSTAASNGDDGVNVGGGMRNTVTKNTIVGNGRHGVTTLAAGDVVVSKNIAAGNDGRGVSIDFSSFDVVVSGNRLLGNGTEGVNVQLSVDVALTANVATGNGSGIVITGTATTLTKNAATANRDFGIVATGMIVDGGGNTARVNGSLFQCSDTIVCPLAFVGKPGPVAPSCGMHVATSIKLGTDMPPCNDSDGIVIDADNVTIDLNGHRIAGNQNLGTNGIQAGAHNKVTIKNGVVVGFGIGIAADFGAKLKIQNVEVRDNPLFGALLGNAGVSITKSVFADNGTGLFFLGTTTDPKVSATFFVANGDTGLFAQGPRAVLTNLVATANEGNGVMIDGSGNGGISGSLVARNSDAGIRVAGVVAPFAISKNVVIGNQSDGIVLTTNGTGVTVTTNSSGGNGQHGLHVGPSQQNALKKNVLVGNGSDGILVEPTAVANVVTGNAALGNANRGIAISAADSTLAKNVARANLAVGISAQTGATDGGGNRASDNAGVVQCTAGIACD